jgi:hypothetical protein
MASYNVQCDHGLEHCEPGEIEPICYEIVCGTCGFRYGDHYGAEPAECPAEDSHPDHPYREEDEDAQRYWTDLPEPEKGSFTGASEADMEALALLLGV